MVVVLSSGVDCGGANSVKKRLKGRMRLNFQNFGHSHNQPRFSTRISMLVPEIHSDVHPFEKSIQLNLKSTLISIGDSLISSNF